MAVKIYKRTLKESLATVDRLKKSLNEGEFSLGDAGLAEIDDYFNMQMDPEIYVDKLTDQQAQLIQDTILEDFKLPLSQARYIKVKRVGSPEYLQNNSEYQILSISNLNNYLLRTRNFINNKYPTFARVYEMMPKMYTLDVPTMATDAYNVYINPAFMTYIFHETGPIGPTVILIHEVFHVLMKHHYRQMRRIWDFPNHQLANIAMDYEINYMIDKVDPEFGKVIKKTGLYDSKWGGWMWEDIYKELEKTGDADNMQNQQNQQGQSGSQGQQGQQGQSGSSSSGQNSQGQQGQQSQQPGQSGQSSQDSNQDSSQGQQNGQNGQNSQNDQSGDDSQNQQGQDGSSGQGSDENQEGKNAASSSAGAREGDPNNMPGQKGQSGSQNQQGQQGQQNQQGQSGSGQENQDQQKGQSGQSGDSGKQAASSSEGARQSASDGSRAAQSGQISTGDVISDQQGSQLAKDAGYKDMDENLKDKIKENMAKQSIKERMKGVGLTPGSGLGDLVEKIDASLEPVVDWQELLGSLLRGLFKESSTRWDPKKIQDREYKRIDSDYGGTSGRNIVLAIDTSGSVDKDMLTRFASEICELLDTLPKVDKVVIMCFDAGISSVDVLNSTQELKEYADSGKLKITGGGGTNFLSVFEALENGEEYTDANGNYIDFGSELINALIIYTDGGDDFVDWYPGNLTNDDESVFWAITGSEVGRWMSNCPMGTVIDLNGL